MPCGTAVLYGLARCRTVLGTAPCCTTMCAVCSVMDPLRYNDDMFLLQRQLASTLRHFVWPPTHIGYAIF
eukprot:1240876-Rhodomonas_salina.2